jgi:hypothetical protein
MTCEMSIEQQLLRHFLAALAYRTQKALRNAPGGFSDFRAGHNVRTPHELIWHMTGVIGYARTLFNGGEWHPERLEPFESEVRRFHDLLEDLATCIESGTTLRTTTYERLLQGPLADAMTHAGQLAMLRRLVGAPVPPENFLLADIRPENLTVDQPPPVAPKQGWTPDQPPPAPGTRTQNVYGTVEAASRYDYPKSATRNQETMAGRFEVRGATARTQKVTGPGLRDRAIHCRVRRSVCLI